MMAYDEDKRKINLAKHGIDLADCEPIFDAPMLTREDEDRKSTRLNSSHQIISYDVFCLKKKNRGCSELRSCHFIQVWVIEWNSVSKLIIIIIWPGAFFFNDTATTEIYTLSLHDALPI